MAQALQAGTPVRRRRALMGLLDADGWGWASVKAFFWFILMIFLLAYLPDRAYYLTVNRTLDLGLLAWSPVNFCPPENKTLPCPAPVGAVVPWEPSPVALALPEARTHGTAAQVGVNLLYVGGSDGAAPTKTTFITTIGHGNLSAWTAGPELPEARADATSVTVGSTVYLIGGTGPDGAATDTIWALTYDQEAKAFGAWKTVKGLVLPAARTGASAIPVSDGIVVAGGFDAAGSPSATVWKANLDPKKGVLGELTEQASLLDGVGNATMAQVGDYIWMWGGRNANGPSGGVQRGHLGTPATEAPPDPHAAPVPLHVLQWAVSDAHNMPGARTASAGFAANGALYVVGGDDGTGPQNELYWATPKGDGTLGAWQHLPETDLPATGIAGAGVALSGANVFVIGGTTTDGVQSGSIRANLAPQEPFFQVGLVGVVVPALRIEGQIGQELGYLNAFGVGFLNFGILIAIAWAYAHPQTVRGWIERRRNRHNRTG